MPKNPKKYFFILAFFCASVWAITACKDDPEPNPCLELAPTFADFVMEEELVKPAPYEVRYFEVDTIGALNNHFIRFTAKDKLADSYEWVVGSDPRVYTTRSFSLQFTQGFGNVPVRLIVKKAPNNACFPEDDGIDTLTKVLHVLPYGQMPIIGEYEGYNLSNPSKIFTIKIFWTTPPLLFQTIPLAGLELQHP
ncbi:MAG: hypothetical protein OHK0053_27600 [Microscillaceae bacterium]